MKKKHEKSLLPAIIVAGLFWAIYTFFFDDFISNDLRLISSYLSEKILFLIGIGVERNGTVLFGNGMRFEVIGACSGSTILKVMLGAGLFLSLSWRGLQWYNRAVAILLSGVLAILANAMRVSILVMLSLRQGHPVEEGILHDSTGIATFIITFIIFCALCQLLSRSKLNKKPAPQATAVSRLHLIIKASFLTLLLTLLYLPFIKATLLDWSGSSWDNTNTFGFFFFFTPLLLACYQSLKSHTRNTKMPQTRACTWLTGFLIVTALLFPIISVAVDVKGITGIGMLILLSAAICYYSGVINTILVTPLLLLSILGFPRILLRLENITPDLITLNPASTRLLIFIVIILIQHPISHRLNVMVSSDSTTDKAPSRSHTLLSNIALYGAIVSLTLTWILPSIYISKKHSSHITINKEQLDLPYLLGSKWQGRDLSIGSSDIAYFGAGNIIYREYTNNNIAASGGSIQVELLITFSGGDRHKNHPPEFCQSGSGWEIATKAAIQTTGKYSRRATILELTKINNETQQKANKYMLYWFTSEDSSEETNFSKMMLEDIASRVSGEVPNWLVIRIFSKSKKSLLEFASKIPYPLKFTK